MSLKEGQRPILVTTDSTLHLYHIFFDQILKNLELTEIIPIFRVMLPEVARTMAGMYVALNGDLKEAARRDLAYISVAGRLTTGYPTRPGPQRSYAPLPEPQPAPPWLASFRLRRSARRPSTAGR